MTKHTLTYDENLSLKPIAITTGEPAGIGPDLVVQLAQQSWPVHLVAITDPDLLHARAQRLNLPLKILDYNAAAQEPSNPGELAVLPCKLIKLAPPGELRKENAEQILEALEIATQKCLNKEFSAVVTGPIHKGIINDAGFKFSGHTEFFADLCHVTRVVMLLCATPLRVALATTHLPLRKVADAITPQLLKEVIKILHYGLQDYFDIDKPTIAVCGLNPHAGENGHLGREEIDTILPTLEELRRQNIQLIGPLPADTAFLPHNAAQSDAILAMYHDQGLPVLKQKDFARAVNLTLGLPFIRTSPDHGTALELAGTGKADTGSFAEAITLAIQIAQRKLSKQATT